jgi:hypothetical protein
VQLLSRQCGVIASWQAETAVISSRRMQDLVRWGRWQRIHHGVYATFTGELPRSAFLWAATLRAGPHAILSHETAAELDGLISGRSRLIHVIVPEPQHIRPVAGIVIHRTSRSIGYKQEPGLPPRTDTEETVLDLAEFADSFDDVVALIARACQRGLSTPFLLDEGLRRRARARWRAEISRALRDGFDGVHSPLEFRYHRDVEQAHGLPWPDRQDQAVQDGTRIFRDIHYRSYRTAVGLDGKASHPDDQRWQDRRRDNAAIADGIVTLRYGWADVTERPCQTARQIATVLASRGWRGTLRRCGPDCRI